MGIFARLLGRHAEDPVERLMLEFAALRRQHRNADAAALLERAVETLTASRDVQVALGDVNRDLGRTAQALEAYQRALTMDPRHPQALYGLADTFRALGRLREAEELLNRVIGGQPDHVDALRQRADLLAASGRHADALVDLDAVVLLRPEDPIAHFSRGMALRAVGRTGASADAFACAVEAQPDFQHALQNLGVVLLELGAIDRASVVFERLVALNPGYPHALGNLFNAQSQLADWQQRQGVTAAILDGIAQGTPVCLPLIALSMTDSAALQQRCSQLLVQERHPPMTTNPWSGATYRHQRIKLAYISGDFHDHAVSYLTAGLLEAHDRGGFEVNAISIGADSSSSMRQRVRDGVDHFIEAGQLSDEAIVGLMREREIDIAIDLAGFTGWSRPGVMARRAAPVQVNYLGFPGTMGAPYIDYILADRRVVPAEVEPYYTEKVVCLPDSFQVNDSKRHVVRQTLTHDDAGLPSTGFVFCSFNNTYKISPDVYDIWMRLLLAVEGSTLWLFGTGDIAMANLRAEAAARGVDPARIVFTTKRPYAAYLDQYVLADLFLDTFPFNAGTTASDALWAGVPVVTCAGQALASRMAGSLLHEVGLPELVTHSLAAYEALALSLARDRTRLQQLRSRLNGAREHSNLFNTMAFCRNVESAYAMMVELSRSGAAPRALSIGSGPSS